MGPLKSKKYEWVSGKMYLVVSCLVYVVLLVPAAKSKD